MKTTIEKPFTEKARHFVISVCKIRMHLNRHGLSMKESDNSMYILNEIKNIFSERFMLRELAMCLRFLMVPVACYGVRSSPSSNAVICCA